MRIALVWHGQIREFENCIKPWQTFIHIHNPDIFIHTWNRGGTCPSTIFRCKSVLRDEPTNLDHLKDGVTDYGSSALNVLPQTYSIYRADKLRTDYEQLHGIRYDWVMRSRMDISLHNPGGIQFAQMSPRKIHVAHNHWTNIAGMYDDNLMVICGESAEISQKFFDLAVGYIQVRRLIPSGEQLLSESLREMKDDVYKNPDLDFTLGRQL